MEAYQVSIILAVLFAIGEMLTTTFILLSFTMALLCIAVFQFVTGSFEVNRDIGLLIVGSISFTIVFRKLFKRQKDQKSIANNEDVNTY